MPKEQVTIPFFIPHEGCPFTCVFCNQHATSGSKASVDALSIREKVIRYRKTVASTIKHVEIAFFGGSFTGLSIDSQKNFLKEAYNCLQEGLVSGIRLSTRPDFISDEIIEIIKEYKVSTIELGVQSFDDSVLGASARGHTADDTKLALIKLKKSKIPFVIQLMPGLPSASFESDIKSAKQACTFKPQGVRIYPTVVVKGTKLEELYDKKLFKPLSLESAIQLGSSLYEIFTDVAIPVIRMGLHPFAEEQVSHIIAGPYHTSFGFLVKSRYRRKYLKEQLELHALEGHTLIKKNVVISIPEYNIEEYIGYKKDNVQYLQSRFNLNSLKIQYSKRNKLYIYSD